MAYRVITRWGFFLLAALVVAFVACAGDDDSQDGTDPSDDDDAADDDTGDDDTGDDDDDSDGAPQPYTPCCDGPATDPALSDPGLPASGPGPFGVLSYTRTFVDDARGREIPAEVFLPSFDGTTPADEGAPYPVVVVAHGFSGFGALVRPYAERLATWGYVAVAPDLPFLSILHFRDLSHTESSLDLLFLLNTICCESADVESPFYGRVDLNRLASIGHSLGGKLSVMASLADGGIAAVAGIDPVDGAGPIEADPDDPDLPDIVPSRVPELLIPTLYLGGTDGRIEFLGQACAPADQNYQEFWTYSPSPSMEITFNDADHTDFIEPMPLDPCNLGTADEARVQAFALEYVVAFLNDRLRDWTRFRDDYAGPGIDADVAAGDVTWRQK